MQRLKNILWFSYCGILMLAYCQKVLDRFMNRTLCPWQSMGFFSHLVLFTCIFVHQSKVVLIKRQMKKLFLIVSSFWSLQFNMIQNYRWTLKSKMEWFHLLCQLDCFQREADTLFKPFHDISNMLWWSMKLYLNNRRHYVTDWVLSDLNKKNYSYFFVTMQLNVFTTFSLVSCLNMFTAFSI